MNEADDGAAELETSHILGGAMSAVCFRFLRSRYDCLPAKETCRLGRIRSIESSSSASSAIRELHNQGVDLISYPMYEANNQPDASDEERAAREGKRPDFQFGFIDHQEPNPDASAKQYVVECKRLGESGRRNWVLNRNYVERGVVRFHDETHGYGKSSSSGAMIGYVQNSSPQRVLDDVNQAASARGIAHIMLSREGWQRGDVSILAHRFDRAVRPTPFDLHHLWLDLFNRSDN